MDRIIDGRRTVPLACSSLIKIFLNACHVFLLYMVFFIRLGHKLGWQTNRSEFFYFFCLIILPNQFGFIFLAACNRILSCELQWHHYCQLTNRSEFLGNDFGAHFEDYYQLARNRIVFNQANILRTVRFAHHLYYWWLLVVYISLQSPSDCSVNLAHWV